eukprot:TRINITY_DN1431_c0_g1_i2.p1 TRINITY_DN1431_c0_g1~~TRINITY_DN1431_c0_g1_i2.p1  ORF type:complete len:325 (-),score=51.56 TRINITY_DN1431_c0_g1_i2:242-1216(-)
MKCFAVLVAAQLLGSAEAHRLRKRKAKTAFCISGNVRANHGLEQSLGLKKLMDDIDPDGLHFAYVNPCEQETEPWAWQIFNKDKQWTPTPCAADPWATSSWKSVLNPTVLKEYRDKDVYPPPHEKYCPNGAGSWAVGVYQQYKGVRECYRLIQDYEKENNFKFETVVRMRADGCASEERCIQSRYCNMDKLDRSKAYMHFHDHKVSFRVPQAKGHAFDNFAIIPRKFATGYFKAIDNWKRCDLGGPGETLVNYQLHLLMSKQWYYSEPMVAEDMCECHDGRFCPAPGQAILARKKSTYEDDVVLVSEELEDKPILPGFFAIRAD